MKSGPVFLWQGSVALLCEACQRLMIRWNIQAPTRSRQAHWYVLIPDHGLLCRSTNIYVCTRSCDTYTYSIRTHAPPLTHFANQLIYESNMAARVGTAKWLEENWMKEILRWLLILAMCRKVEKKSHCSRDIFPSPWLVDCKLVPCSSVQDTLCDPWFHSALEFCKKAY